MNKFVIKKFVSEDDIFQMCELDKRTFKDLNQVDFDVCKSWYNKNPQIYTAIMKDDTLIGYINFMPVTDTAYKKFREGKLSEQSLTAKDIKIMRPNKEYYCLFLSVVIDKKYQNTEAFTILISNFYKNTKTYLQTHNISIKSILADCVNKKMEQFVKNSGFKRVFKNENYNIYEGNIFSK